MPRCPGPTWGEVKKKTMVQKKVHFSFSFPLLLAVVPPPSFFIMGFNLTVKQVSGESFVVENVELSTSVAEIKSRIEKLKSWAAASQKLIYSGKILTDDKALKDYSVAESGFLVCVVSAPKKPAPAPAASAPPASAQTPAAVAKPVTAQAQPAAPAKAPSAAAASPSAPSPAAAPSAAAMVKESDVALLREMVGSNSRLQSNSALFVFLACIN